MNDAVFSQIDFGPLKEFLEEDNITDVSYSNGGQVWLKTLDKGVYRVERPEINNALMEKLAFQCSNVMGKTFNMAHPFLDAESAELRLNFVHESIATNGICCVIRKTPAKIRLNKEKLITVQRVFKDPSEKYFLTENSSFRHSKMMPLMGYQQLTMMNDISPDMIDYRLFLIKLQAQPLPSPLL